MYSLILHQKQEPRLTDAAVNQKSPTGDLMLQHFANVNKALVITQSGGG